MNSIKIFSIVAIIFAGTVLAQSNNTCPQGYWGPGCLNPCGQCYTKEEPVMCDYKTGACPNGCVGGYSGNNCDIAVCKQDCGNGECLAPNFCGNCGDINKVSPNCEDIRLRGLLGSLMAFIVIISSITLCGFGSVWYKKQKKNVAVNL